MKTLFLALLGAAALFALGAQSARAGDYVCTASAIHAKSAFTKHLWNRLENNKISDAEVTPAIDKVWDGRGDCSGEEPTMSTFSFTTISELVQTHYLGDMMSAEFADGMKQYALARKHLDDFWEAEDFVQSHADRMPRSFMAEDGEIVNLMKQLDTKLTKLGYGSKRKK